MNSISIPDCKIMKEYNVLVLSAGRRVELIQCFKAAAQRLGITTAIITADVSDTAPAIYFADRKHKLPRINQKGYLEAIVDICIAENVSLVVPTIDTELISLAKNKDFIEEKTEAKVLISDFDTIRICRDKILTSKFLEDNGFSVPRLYYSNEIQNTTPVYPLFIKPKSGSSSIQAHKVCNEKELELYLNMINEPIIQDYINGDEYTVDVFLDFESNVITVVPRLRIETRSGEILKGKIVKDRAIIENVLQLMKALKPIGHITVQLIKSSEKITYIEINPRFGGGAPMSIKSGADSCEYLFRLLMGESLSYHEDYRDNQIYLRFDQSICLNSNMEIIQ